MTIITGHRGFLGTRLHEQISDAIGVDLQDGQNLLTCTLPYQSLNDELVIYHLAAQTSVEASWHDPLHDLNNIRTAARLAHEYPNAKIIYANSCAAIDPKSPYGFSKKAAGEYLKAFHSNVVNCIFPNIYGPRSKSVVDIFKNLDEVPVYGDGMAVRDYVHIDDIIDGLLKAQNWPVGDYFMGSGVGTTVIELTLGKPIKWLPARKEEREVIVKNTTPDWTPKTNVFDYLT